MPPRSENLADRTYRRLSAVGIGAVGAWTVVWIALGIDRLVPYGAIALGGLLLMRGLRHRLGYVLATRLSVVSCLVVILAGILLAGGMDGPFGVMLMILPLIPALALSTGESLRWGGVVVMLGAAAWGAESVLGPFRSEVPPGYSGAFRALTQFTVAAATLLCIATYGRMHEQARQRLRYSRAELERSHHELQLSQQKLIVAEKMAALGRLSAGMAHEINSSLSGALNSLEMALMDGEAVEAAVSDPEPGRAAAQAGASLRESLGLASTALNRIAAFVRRMRGHTAAGASDDAQHFSAGEEAETVLRLLQVTLLDAGVAIRSTVDEAARLQGDPARFGQIVQNLVTNAADAYEGVPGEVILRLFRDQGSVVLEVEDRGVGIPEEIRDRIFEHFFTTKDVGRGTGLGLALVHDLVTGYFGGTIAFTTTPGYGTRFVVRLPAAGEQAA